MLIAMIVLALTSPPDGQIERAPIVAHLGEDGADSLDFDRLRRAFGKRNPGYDVRFERDTRHIGASGQPAIVFVQRGSAHATVGELSSDVEVGDVVLLRPTQRMHASETIDCVVFDSPKPLPDDCPAFVRPDWDEHITDTPGGCAEETGAYRRICLTWLESRGGYIYHGLNTHRVRISDSFTHYHPIAGGFDEFYLVQMVQPGARLITSVHPELIESRSVSAQGAASLLREHELRAGDLVYLPRGVVHRGLDGVLAHVIAIPGFIPGAEIGVDHQLRAINEQLGLSGDDALPYHEAASASAVRK